jgi:hypothetical protein
MGYSVKASTPGKIVRGPEPPEDPEAREDPVLCYQARIRQSLEKEDFQTARALLEEALGECPEEPALLKLLGEFFLHGSQSLAARIAG